MGGVVGVEEEEEQRRKRRRRGRERKSLTGLRKKRKRY